ncbi:MarR family transcriptional regulator [Sphingomonas sp. SUN039]|uniref:MarR family transcriptional regulator n=1 Tax=Sphingomonas sp. SUN039 TaxID=2937787 RepID=UPI002164A22A|nr:MarR family transcriptional regulator [Sphingomonas sp. SUN039]UVO52903.1 MarR family transcriptional regulator [Sphingomonas sp. SUN039]
MFETLSKAEQMALADIADRRRAVWVVTDDLVMRGEMQGAVAAAGGRVSRAMSIDEALAALGDRPYETLVLLDTGDVVSGAVATLLDRIDADASDGGRAAIISFPLSAIDFVTSRISAPFASLLCAPSIAERAAAIGLADIPAALHLAEVDRAVDTIRLQQLAEEVGRIARVLAGYAEPGAEPPRRTVSDGLIGYRAGPPQSPSGAPQNVRAEDVRTMLRLRRQRDSLFAGELFADPAWDMMLDLMAARIERLKVAVSSLCIAAAVPPTTALRWIRTLTDLGIFVRVADPTDGRRVFIELSDTTAAKLLDYLGEAKHAGTAML